MLLQISEPENKKSLVAAAIDLGTTNSLIAFVQNKKATVVEIDGKKLIPSAVHIKSDKNVLVGNLALEEKDTSYLVRSFKRMVGKNITDGKKINFAHQIVGENTALIKIGGTTISPTQLSAYVLHFLTEKFSIITKKEIGILVVTAPAYFNNAERNTIKDAGSIIGFNDIKILNEPTAAAIAYGLNDISGITMVYDLGGGTFDVSVLKIENGVFSVLAVGGNTSLGGDDVDVEVAKFLCKKAKINNYISKNNSQILGKYTAIAKEVKENFLCKKSQTIKIDNLSIEMSLAEFDNVISDFVEKTISICKKTLSDAFVENKNIENIVLVGGSSRISLIETKIKQEFGQSPLCSINPDEVVALGAAIHAQELQTQENDLLLLDVTPLSLGLETMGKLMEVVIPRNTTIPVKKRQEFTTYKNGQTSIDINIYQGERQEVSECIFLGKFKVDNLSPSSAGAVKISVDFEINENGILTVSSHEIGKKDIKKITLNPTDNLENSAIIEMLTQSQKNFAKDVQKRILIESKQKANQIIEMLTQAIEENKSLLEKNEEKSIFAQIKNIENISLPSQEKENKDLSKLANNINKQVDILDNMSSNFMQKIMDEAINKAMVNKSIENI